MKFKFKSARTWTYIVKSIKEILDEGVFVATKDGLSLRALDTSRVVMVDLYFPRESFDEYEAKDEESVGVSFDALSKVLSRALKDESLSMETEGNNLKISFEGHGTRTFSVPQISLATEKLPEPKINFSVTAKLMTQSFIDAVKAVEEVADTITIYVPPSEEKSGKLYFVGAGDVEKVEVELSLDKENLLEIKVDSPDKATYTVEYFDVMLKAARGADTVVLQYAQDAPVRVELDYEGAGRLVFYVSPRVE